MKQQTSNKEILLFTNTSFAKRELCKTGSEGHHEENNVAALLEQACWSGLLFEMLPDVFNSKDQKNLFVWKINQAHQFIHITMGNAPCSFENKTSVHPYFFQQSSRCDN